MRKLISLFVITLLLAGSALAAGPSGPGVAGDILGQAKLASDPHRIFRLVRYKQQETLHPGAAGSTGDIYLTAESIVVWDTRDGATYGNCADGVTVTTTTTSYDSRVAGIIILSALSAETIGNTAAQDRGLQNWAYLQTYGYCEVRQGLTTASSGDALATGAQPGEAHIFNFHTIEGASTQSSARWGIAGFYMENATAGEDNVKVFLRLD